MLGMLLKLLLLPFRLITWLIGLVVKGLVFGSCGCLAAAALVLVVIAVALVLLFLW